MFDLKGGVKLDRTVCELFAGVGGFRCGLNNIKTLDDLKNPEKWNTVWFNQFEPSSKKQYAYGCYTRNFENTINSIGGGMNTDISKVDKTTIPNFNLLVGGFPCQDYSVARKLKGEQGIEGKKGVLWWDIYEILKIKQPPFVLLENVDRLLKSPSTQRGRDFGIMLSCFAELGYIVEWRVINAAEYGCVQRRRRTFIFAYKNNTKYANTLSAHNIEDLLYNQGFFGSVFPICPIDVSDITTTTLSNDILDVSNNFKFEFLNTGVMINYTIYCIKSQPMDTQPRVIGDVLENHVSDLIKYVIPTDRLYYTDIDINKSDETITPLTPENRKTYQYLKGGKKKNRVSSDGHSYVYSERAMPMVDEWDKPARTMVTSEGSFNRSTHIVRDKETLQIRNITPIEAERIQGFPDNWTKECYIDGKIIDMPNRARYFCMGNALVVDLISKMEVKLSEIFDNE